jgi:hypothetical protein
MTTGAPILRCERDSASNQSRVRAKKNKNSNISQKHEKTKTEFSCLRDFRVLAMKSLAIQISAIQSNHSIPKSPTRSEENRDCNSPGSAF